MNHYLRNTLYFLDVIFFLFLTACVSPLVPPTSVVDNTPATLLPTTFTTRVPSATPHPTKTSTPTAIPEPITFDNVCKFKGKRVELEGILQLPNQISCTTNGSPDWCTVQLIDVDRVGHVIVALNVAPGSNPGKNHMANLPNSYDLSDFRVNTNEGKLVGNGTLVRLSGIVDSPVFGYTSDDEVPCSLKNITIIERIKQLTVSGPEKIDQANLPDAITNGWVVASITGNGLSKIDVKLQPKIEFTLELSIKPGTIFEAKTGGVQNMVVRKGTVVVLKPGVEVSLELEVSCANMELEEPSELHTFGVKQNTDPNDLMKLLALDEFTLESQRIQQFAIWTITDNPRRDGYTGISSDFSVSDKPTDTELRQIEELFKKAEIDTSKYKAFTK
jgi:hypothetical protein